MSLAIEHKAFICGGQMFTNHDPENPSHSSRMIKHCEKGHTCKICGLGANVINPDQPKADALQA